MLSLTLFEDILMQFVLVYAYHYLCYHHFVDIVVLIDDMMVVDMMDDMMIDVMYVMVVAVVAVVYVMDVAIVMDIVVEVVVNFVNVVDMVVDIVVDIVVVGYLRYIDVDDIAMMNIEVVDNNLLAYYWNNYFYNLH